MCCAEDPVPDAESKAVVDTVDTRRQILGMVPNVHLWCVEDVLQGANRQNDVGVVEMTYRSGKDADGKKVHKIDPEQHQGDVLKRSIDDVLGEVKAQVCGKAHLLDAVVDLVKLPQHG
ncbi:MAG: hypothetical protein RIR53_244 [Bacteroidota bacterium]